MTGDLVIELGGSYRLLVGKPALYLETPEGRVRLPRGIAYKLARQIIDLLDQGSTRDPGGQRGLSPLQARIRQLALDKLTISQAYDLVDAIHAKHDWLNQPEEEFSRHGATHPHRR